MAGDRAIESEVAGGGVAGGCGKEVHPGDLASMGIAHPWPKVDEISATLFDVGLGNVLLIFF